MEKVYMYVIMYANIENVFLDSVIFLSFFFILLSCDISLQQFPLSLLLPVSLTPPLSSDPLSFSSLQQRSGLPGISAENSIVR